MKTLSGSKESGVFLAEDKGRFDDLMQLIEVTNKKANIILQEFMLESKGIGLRVFTLGGRATACFMTYNKVEDLKRVTPRVAIFNYMRLRQNKVKFYFPQSRLSHY